MNNVKKNIVYRFERKFVIDTLCRSGVELIIKQNPFAFSPIYHERFINNIYFDTPSLNYFFDNHIGKSERKKVRIRWYGDFFGIIYHPVLEFKFKEGHVGWKESFKLKEFVLDKNFNNDDIKTIIKNSDVPNWVIEETIKLEPTLLNRYTRKYLQSFNKKYRITIDNDLVYRNISKRNNSFTNESADNNLIIIELKYNFEFDETASKVSNYFPFRLTKNSKYVNGIEIFNCHLAV
ncbi:MAG: polyphosphate polymerase domain-containing protein [Bacteroidales bacterium]|nr:polyphosphate polymerase domain-containing protein [Bacteroidales bacterium]